MEVHMHDHTIDVMKTRVLENLDLENEVSDESIINTIDSILSDYCRSNYLSLEQRQEISRDIFCNLRKLDILQELLDDDTVTEIMVNGPENIFVEINGRVKRWNKSFAREEKLRDIIQQIVSFCNRVVNESSPIVDARLPDGSRINVVLKPIALNGPILTIRKFAKHRITMEKLIELGAISSEAADFLTVLVKAKYNIFISGGTGSGKTTFLNALSDYVPEDERIITIEDAAELQIKHVPNLVSLEARNGNGEGCVPIAIRDLIKSALRMRPDRIIVGEIRGEEAIDMLQAMNTGHDGSLSTGHANSSRDMLSRIETMVLMGVNIPLEAIRNQIGSAIDIIVHLQRMSDRSRKVVAVEEIAGVEKGEIQLNTLYEFSGGKMRKVNSLINREKLYSSGYNDQALGGD